jgi:hypothetical protein
MCGYTVVSSQRECSRWQVLIVYVFRWYWLPCRRIFLLLYPIKLSMFIYIACNYNHYVPFHPMHLLHKHLRTCIIQDRKQRIQSSYPRSRKSSSRCRLGSFSCKLPVPPLRMHLILTPRSIWSKSCGSTP